MKRIYIENGYYLFKLEKLLEDRNISINQLMRDTNTDYKVLKRIIDGEVIRLDTTVLARICDYLGCGSNEIVEYCPNKK